MSLFKLAIRKKTVIVFGGLLLCSLVLAKVLNYKDHLDAWIGVWAAITVVLLEQLMELFIQWRRFSRLAGPYEAYRYIAEIPHGERTADQQEELLEDPDATIRDGSMAELLYLGDSSFEMSVTDSNGNQWMGRVVMESDEVGVMAWAYNKLAPENTTPWKRNGIKRLAVIDRSTKQLKLCIFSYNNDERFGRELFIKEPLSPSIVNDWPSDWLARLIWVTLSLGVLLAVLAFTS